MLDLFREVDRPFGYVCMHHRGDSQTMMTMTEYANHGGVLAGVVAELREGIRGVLNHGARRWQVLVDPGLGFAKKAVQSVELVQRMDEFVDAMNGLPVLVGASRKKFLEMLVQEGREGDLEMVLAAVVSKCVSSGVDIVRVHSVTMIKDVVAAADKIWRKQW